MAPACAHLTAHPIFLPPPLALPYARHQPQPNQPAQSRRCTRARPPPPKPTLANGGHGVEDRRGHRVTRPGHRLCPGPVAPPPAVGHAALTKSLTNTSFLIDYCHDDGTHRYILIDVGKTFREQVLRWFVHHKIPSIDLGLDDVWVVQPSDHGNYVEPTPIFLTQFTMDSIAARFPYLMNQAEEDGDEDARAAQLDWKIIKANVDKPFGSSGLELVPLPVMHREGYVVLGFLFVRRGRVAYLSDVSRFLPSTEHGSHMVNGRYSMELWMTMTSLLRLCQFHTNQNHHLQFFVLNNLRTQAFMIHIM